MASLRVATVNWKLRIPRSDSRFFGHFYDLVSEAHEGGAELVVFPELLSLELLPLAKDVSLRNGAKYLAQYGPSISEWIGRISASSGMTIVGGSHFMPFGDLTKNIGMVGLPDGSVIHGEKNNLTRFEREIWSVESGAGLSQFQDKFGMTICYDCEFPGASRALAEAGVLVQCVPSWTETEHGFNRVRYCCLARAIELQSFVIHSALVGDFGAEPVPESYGASAVIAPSISPFPMNPILAETETNEEGIAFAELDFELLDDARNNGEVTNWDDRNRGTWVVSQTAGHSQN